ncbi:MAG: hypothetical protein U1F16_05550 [Turneriella sp.]
MAAASLSLEYHRQMHEFMAARPDFLTKQLRHGLLEKNELIEFMESWLTEHIIMEDMRYIRPVTRGWSAQSTRNVRTDHRPAPDSGGNRCIWTGGTSFCFSPCCYRH